MRDGLSVSHEVRLAVAWYPDLSDDTPAPPRAIVTEELAYTGSFPQSFTFRLYGPPAPEALAPVTVGDGAPAGKAAVGQLVAYEDVDGDGRLSVDAQGRATERILGSTAGAGAFDFYTTATRHLVLWAQDGAERGLELEGLTAGYNLLRYEDPLSPPVVLPLTTALPIALTAEPRLALIACPEAYVEPQPETACGVRVWDTPAVNGTVSLQDDGSIDAFVLVSTASGTSSMATVRINGVEIPRDGSNLAHALTEAAPSVLHTGVNVVEVQQPGYQPVTLQAVVPARFDVTAPLPGTSVTAGSSLTVRWTAATGATRYGVSLFVDGARPTDSALVAATSAQVQVPDGVGPGELSVVAYERLDFSRASVLGLSVRTLRLDVTR